MGKRITHLWYSWWKYFLVLLCAFLLWMTVFDMLAAPEKNEKIQITYIGDNFLCEELNKALEQKMPELTEQHIKSVSVENPVNAESKDYYSVMATRAYGADLVIVEESAMTEDIGKTYFIPLPVEKLPEYLGSPAFYTEDELPYGILLYDGSTPNGFSQFYTGTQRCFLFITHTSVNAAGIMDRGNAEDDAALRIIMYLLEGI